MEAANPADVEAIEDYNRRLADATNRGDLAALAQLIARDHVTLAPDQPPVIGRDACLAIMSDVLGRFSVTEEHGPTRTEVDSMLAYQRGDFTVTLVPRIGGETVVRSGKYLRIYRRQADGAWMMVVDSFSANHPDGGWGELLADNEVAKIGCEPSLSPGSIGKGAK